ncbi:uncharacterized protein CG42266-like [Homalodisca vitripennis]|uniref:uncharacterized protein CG42266-like n=1 Tax=Homalodisca vitripennis TaxID=197043 RepID=UPI001EEB8216|nr:uncharacterized protein CG42266-like [Homalodisca vitripennis]
MKVFATILGVAIICAVVSALPGPYPGPSPAPAPGPLPAPRPAPGPAPYNRRNYPGCGPLGYNCDVGGCPPFFPRGVAYEGFPYPGFPQYPLL